MSNTTRKPVPARTPDLVPIRTVSDAILTTASKHQYTPIKPTPDEKLDIAEALASTNGNYAMVGKRLNRSRAWVMVRILYDVQLQELVEEIKQTVVDNVLSALQIKAMAGDYACMNRILNTLGRERGLHEKQEIVVEHKDESPQALEVQLNAAFGHLTPDQIRLLAGI